MPVRDGITHSSHCKMLPLTQSCLVLRILPEKSAPRQIRVTRLLNAATAEVPFARGREVAGACQEPEPEARSHKGHPLSLDVSRHDSEPRRPTWMHSSQSLRRPHPDGGPRGRKSCCCPHPEAATGNGRQKVRRIKGGPPWPSGTFVRFNLSLSFPGCRPLLPLDAPKATSFARAGTGKLSTLLRLVPKYWYSGDLGQAAPFG